MSKPIVPHHQVVIIGGGPGGTTCAIALARLGLKDILILESGEYDRFRIGESLPPEIRPIFSQLGLLEGFLAQKHEPCYGSCSYWGDDKRGYNDSIMSVYGHGWHLDRRRFNQFLARRATQAGASLWHGVTFVDSEPCQQGGFLITVRDNRAEAQREKRPGGNLIRADFVVDATGASGAFARRQGSRKQHDRPLICLGSRFSLLSESPKITKMTHLEAVRDGWWYAARLPDDTMLVALTTDADTLKKKAFHHPDHWLSCLREAPNTSKLIGETHLIDRRPQSYPAPSFRLDKIVGPHWLALGDAASAYDPITSQGIIKSMSDALFAAGAIEEFLEGQERALEIFAREVADRYLQYVEMRDYFYRLEQRWPESPFWLVQQGLLTVKLG